VALVTGAARGLGAGIARALAEAGCDVAVSDVGRTTDGTTPYDLASRDDLAATARAIEGFGRRSVAVLADVTSATEVTRLLGEVERTLGGLDILVANAGIIAAAPVVSMDEAVWDRIFAVNVKGVFLCVRATIAGGGEVH
jgi:meso-butanediol dehydrogenase/(S,S)-butanediol dehydrogenase/diacetyl reductase